MNTQEKISIICDNLKHFIQEKNRLYGDSALNAVNIFCKDPNYSNENSICLRLNDKAGRILNSKELRKNDLLDLMGYIILLCIEKDWTDFKDQID